MTTVILDSPERVAYAQRIIGKLPLDPPGWDVRIEKHVEKRSVKQNARHWAVCQKIAEHTGYSAADIHEFALCIYFGSVEQQVGGIIRLVPLKRSSTRNVKEFHDFQESTEAWGISEFGVFLGDDE